MPNLPGSPDRRAVIMGWEAAKAGGKPLLSPEYTAQLEGAGRLTPTLRRLIGAA